MIVDACAILHNFCKDRGIPLPDEEEADGPAEDVEDVAAQQPAAGPVARGIQAQRDHFAYLHFK